MIQKYVIAIILVFAFLVVSIPNPVDAKEPMASDWVKKKQTDDQSEPEETEDSTVSNTSEDKSLVVIIIKLIFYTLLILVMIYALIKFLALRQKKLQPNQAVKLMGGTPLGNNKSLQLVKVGKKVYLIGVGDQVTLIKEFSESDEINNIESDLEKQSTLFTSPLANISTSIASIVNFSREKMSKRMGSKPNLSFDHLFKQSLTKQKGKQDQLKQDLNEVDEDKEGNSK
ncbi:flagellar biosynthetic protein FliO [Paenisporosarcina sp. OV554]|uniref:flagellar biosynthetic protein FliO n=1 Tax=Paenisporosarcina sp. OV554 TaxID=2135694 RepID=UPI000D34C337|nr:flagellar biosynthetic protein FliO [Paenisporosarcina sp. OV554]PUB14662.1 flagellar protein FliO/FliZ [Paenisporosarcina sp. OV554]